MDVLEPPDVGAWDAWLSEHHATATEAWLRLRHKTSDLALMTFEDAGDVALCHGWIDGLRRGLDDVSYLQRYTPRRPGAAWSQVNVARVERLEAAGRMRPGGMAQVEAARADGRWAAAYPPQSAGVMPHDLATALAADPVAAQAFAALDRSSQYAIELPLFKARTEKSRAALLEKALAKLRAGVPGDGA